MSVMTDDPASCRPSAQGDGCPGAASAVAALVSKAPIVTAYVLKRENTGICITAPVPQSASGCALDVPDFAHVFYRKTGPLFRNMREVWSLSRLPFPAPNRRYRDSLDATCCR